MSWHKQHADHPKDFNLPFEATFGDAVLLLLYRTALTILPLSQEVLETVSLLSFPDPCCGENGTGICMGHLATESNSLDFSRVLKPPPLLTPAQ